MKTKVGQAEKVIGAVVVGFLVITLLIQFPSTGSDKKDIVTPTGTPADVKVSDEKKSPLHGPFHDLQATDGKGSKVAFNRFEGKVVLVVNVASKCGYTHRDYTWMQEVYRKYYDLGFEVLAFPCNQFGEQEPDANPEILQFVQDTFAVTFPIFNKIDVNGPKTHPVYSYLKSKFPGDVSWNFTKFLISRDGKVVSRFSTQTLPADVEKELIAELARDIPQ